MHLKLTEHLISEGTFGKVFEGKLSNENAESERDVAVKIGHVTNKVNHPLLLHEACALSILQGQRNIPEVYAWGRSQFYEYMALQKLGPTLRELFEADKRKPLSVKNLVILVCQMLDAVKHVHSHGIIHRDIKPANFLLGPPDTELSGRLYLVDFGLSKRYRDLRSDEHLPETRTGRTTASRTFSSAWDQIHMTPSRRDDMISLAYTIIALLAPPVPWDRPLKEDFSDEEEEEDGPSDGESSSEEDSPEEDSSEEDSPKEDSSEKDSSEHESSEELVTFIPRRKRWTMLQVVNSKVRWARGAAIITKDYPQVFGDFFEYALSLEYDEDPNYDWWKKEFRDAMPGLPDDPLYDPADTDGEMAGTAKRGSAKPGRVPENDRISTLELSHPRTPVPQGDDGWEPAAGMQWRGPHTLESSDMLKDNELKFILGSGIHIIEEPPTTDIPLLDATCPPERMGQVGELKRSFGL